MAQHDSANARMEASLLAFWAGPVRSSTGARVVLVGGIAAAVFPAPGERALFNNAVAPRWTPLEGSALAALATLYRAHGSAQWQLWVHEEEQELSRRAAAAGLVVDTSTQGMSMPLTHVAAGRGAGQALDLVPSPTLAELCELIANAERLLPQLRAAGRSNYRRSRTAARGGAVRPATTRATAA